MNGYAVRMNRMYKGHSQDVTDAGDPVPNVLTERCNLLFVASGVFFIVGTIVMIPGFFGDTNFFIYSASSFGVGLVILTFACLCTTIIEKEDDTRAQHGSVTALPTITSPAKHLLEDESSHPAF